MDFSDIFEEFFGGFTGMGGFGRRQRNAPRRGADINQVVTLTFEEAVFGVDKEIEITRDEVCRTCGGSGAEPGTRPVRCATCGGQGEVRQVRQTFLGSMVQVTTCPNCNGRGEVIETPCRTCRGRGLERRTVKKTVAIPAGVDKGIRSALPAKASRASTAGRTAICTLKLTSSRTSSSSARRTTLCST